MSIAIVSRAVQASPLDGHDPLVCGITGPNSLCPSCARGANRDFVERSADAKNRNQNRQTNRRLQDIGIDLDALAAALLPALAVGIAEIVGAVLEEMESAA